MHPIILNTMQEQLDIWRFPADTNIHDVLPHNGFFSITCTKEELSLVCNNAFSPDLEGKVERNWRAFQVAGPLDFSLTGIMNRLLQPLAEAGISIFALSTFDTDYLLVREPDFLPAKRVLGQHFEIK